MTYSPLSQKSLWMHFLKKMNKWRMRAKTCITGTSYDGEGFINIGKYGG